MKYFFPYAGGFVDIHTDDMDRLPSGRAWVHIKELCAPEVGKRVASGRAARLVHLPSRRSANFQSAFLAEMMRSDFFADSSLD